MTISDSHTTAASSVVDDIIKMLPDIDPDSTRMVEWLWATRHRNGMNTYGDDFFIPANPNVKLSEIADKYFKEHFTHYYHSRNLFRAMRESEDGKYIDLYIVASVNDCGDCNIVALGDEDTVSGIMTGVSSTYKRPKTVNITALLGFNDQGPIEREYEVSEETADCSKQEFYPWLSESIDEFAENFTKSKSNVLLLIGPPGTGKSTFIRTLLFKLNRENIGVVDDYSVQQHPNISTWVRGHTDNAVVVFEDADMLVGKREDGNAQMSMLLNLSDGIISSDTKIIISTNLPSINKVDEALLRPGRNYAILEFRNLNSEEANVARQAIDMEKVDFDPNNTYTLAESLAHTSILEIERRRSGGIGFTK